MTNKESELARRLKQRHAELVADNDFWHWFIPSGVRELADRWIFAHGLIGVILAFAIPGKLSDVAGPACVPFVAILVGMAVSWSGNANTILQTAEMQSIGAGKDRDYSAFRHWVFKYQAAVLVVLSATTAWTLVSAGLLNSQAVETLPPWVRLLGRATLFAYSSLTVRESWHVVCGVQLNLLGLMEFRRARAERAERAELDERLRLEQPHRLRVGQGEGGGTGAAALGRISALAPATGVD